MTPKPGSSFSKILYENKLLRRNDATPTINVKAPENFSLVHNADETIAFFEKAHSEIRKGNKIILNINHITTLTTDAIAVQIAKIKDRRFHLNRPIIGNAPKDMALKKLFLQSGFYDHVTSAGYKPQNNNRLLIHKITTNKVEPKLAKEACLLGLRHVFNNEDIFEPLYDILIEIMQNTNNHAGKTKGKYDWWLYVYNHPDENKTSYTFLDLGVGIFESLSVQTFKRNILEALGLVSNLELVEKLFNGEIKSRTARPERGKGIPQVFECSQDPIFSKFYLVANDIHADLKSRNYRHINHNFEGTLFHWEIENIQTENIHGN